MEATSQVRRAFSAESSVAYSARATNVAAANNVAKMPTCGSKIAGALLRKIRVGWCRFARLLRKCPWVFLRNPFAIPRAIGTYVHHERGSLGLRSSMIIHHWILVTLLLFRKNDANYELM